MKIEPTDAVVLAAVIRRDLDSMLRVEEHARRLSASPLGRTELDSLGFALHNLYNALENSLAQISLTFENHVRDQTRWRRELLEKMFLDLGVLRPPVFPAKLRPLLADLLGFRHVFRHAYDFTLDESRIKALWERWAAQGPAAKQALAEFANRLSSIGESGQRSGN
jgi:HepT-like protein